MALLNLWDAIDRRLRPDKAYLLVHKREIILFLERWQIMTVSLIFARFALLRNWVCFEDVGRLCSQRNESANGQADARRKNLFCLSARNIKRIWLLSLYPFIWHSAPMFHHHSHARQAIYLRYFAYHLVDFFLPPNQALLFAIGPSARASDDSSGISGESCQGSFHFHHP